MGLLFTTRTKIVFLSLMIIFSVSYGAKKDKKQTPKNALNEAEMNFTKNMKLDDVFTKENLIPIILITPINSHLKGKVLAVVESDCYAEHGSKVIIPKGSKVTGKYLPIQSYSQERIVILWERLITPTGNFISLKNSQTADSQGNIGIIGDLDKRYWERYGLSLTLSTLSNYLNLKTTLSALDNQNRDTNNSSLLDYSTQETQNELIDNFTMETRGESKGMIEQILQEQLLTKPVMVVEKGIRMFIVPKYDIRNRY